MGVICNDNNIRKTEVSFRCYYNVKEKNEYIYLIKWNKEIKILNGNKKEKLCSPKTFGKTGLNSVDFIIEGKLTDMSFLFFMCQSLIKVEFISIDTSNVTDMSYMFQGCESLKKVEFISFDTYKVKNMEAMFLSCKELEYLDLSKFNTSNVTNMSFMFCGCVKLKEIKGINNFNTSKVIDMAQLFSSCKSLEYLDLSNFNTSNVTIMSCMFSGCPKLKEIKGINNFNISKVKSMIGMFNLCNSLEYLDLSNFDTSKVEKMDSIFRGCSNLKEIKGITNFIIPENTEFFGEKGIFQGCKELDYLYLSNGKIAIDLEKVKTKLNNSKENSIAIIFFITEQNIHYPVSCFESDIFTKIENKLLSEFPELKSKQFYYLASGSSVDKNATLKENKIKDGTTILVNFIDENID